MSHDRPSLSLVRPAPGEAAPASPEGDTTVAVITHNAVIAGLGDRVVTMKDGRIAEVRTNPTRVAPAALDW